MDSKIFVPIHMNFVMRLRTKNTDRTITNDIGTRTQIKTVTNYIQYSNAISYYKNRVDTLLDTIRPCLRQYFTYIIIE